MWYCLYSNRHFKGKKVLSVKLYLQHAICNRNLQSFYILTHLSFAGICVGTKICV